MISTFQKISHSARRYGRVITAAACLYLVAAPSVFAAVVNLGSAANYTVLGEGGTGTFSIEKVYQSDTLILGNVGMGPYTTLDHYVDATINGRFDFDLTDNAAQVAIQTAGSAISGGVHQVNLMGVVADARAASAIAAAYVPTQTFTGSQFEALDGTATAIIGGHGLNVIRVTGDVALKKTLTISGFADSSFIFQFTSTTADGHDILSFSGMNMILLGGVLSDNLLWNMQGLGGGIDIQAMAAGQTVYGTFLAPDRDILGDHAIVNGRLIGGGSGNLLSIHSGSEITLPPPVPEPATFIAGALLLLPFGASTLRILRRKPEQCS
jgi:hypothetical protein